MEGKILENVYFNQMLLFMQKVPMQDFEKLLHLLKTQ
jgi:hypothetical protein